MDEDTVMKAAIQVSAGTGLGVGAALTHHAVPHLVGAPPIVGSVNTTAKFSHAATKSLQANHKNISGAIAAGTAAVVGHGAIGTVVIAVAPVAVGAAVVAGAGYGLFKLAKFVRDEWL
jgi:hypothetical protein